MVCKAVLCLLIVILFLGYSNALAGTNATTGNSELAEPTAGDVVYVYDELGRLVAVIDSTGDTAVYSYDAVGNLLSISRHSSSTVAVIEFTPNSGAVGASVTIYGTGFSNTPSQNTVTFNGVAASVTSATANQIVTSVPVGATTGLVAVTSPSGSATSSGSFTVTTTASGPPNISGFTPAIATIGTAVTINGTNFETTLLNNNVSFHQTHALPSTTTVSSISTNVPSAATSGRLTVSTPGGVATSNADFFVPPSPFVATDVVFTGRMTIGSTATATVGTSNKVGLMVFEGTAGHRLSMNMSGVTIGGNSNVSITRPNGTILLGATLFNSSGKFIDPLKLVTTGTYQILLDPSGTNTGNASLTLYDVPPDPTGTITPGGSPAAITTTVAGQNAQFSFAGTAGQKVSLKMTAVTIANSDVDIYRPDGTILGSAPDVGTGGGFIDTKTLATTDTYTIKVNPSGTNTGNMTLTLYDVVDVMNSITPGGSSVPLTITTPGQNALVTFSGTSGQKVSLNITGVTIQQAFAWIEKPDGTDLVSEVSFGTSGKFINSVTLPVTGTYTIFINPSVSNIGNATLTLYDTADVTGSITAGGSAVTVTTTVPGQNARLTFTGTAGQRVSLKTTNVTMGSGTITSILNPDGSVLGSFSGVAAYIDVKTLSVNGNYEVLLNPASANTGSATVTLYDVPPDVTGTLTIGGGSIGVTITTPGQNGALTFSGTSGQQATVRITNNTIGSITVTLLKPDGTQLTQSVASGSSFNLATQTLPTTGTYTINLDPTGDRTGSINVNVTSP